MNSDTISAIVDLLLVALGLALLYGFYDHSKRLHVIEDDIDQLYNPGEVDNEEVVV